MKQNIILLLCLSFGLFSCYDDKGNYDYREIDELTITGMPEEPVTALSKAENLVVRPTVTSKFDGEISADDPNYEFAYYYNKPAGSDFLEPSLLDSAMVKDLDILAVMSPGAYTAWFKVKDLRTNIVTSTEFKIQISTSTTQGWLVLCEEGEDRKVRVDMLGEVGERIFVSRNVLDFLPEMHGACQMYMQSNLGAYASPYLNLYSEDNSFRIWSYNGDFSQRDYDDPRGVAFARFPEDFVVQEERNYACVVVTSNGDAYLRANDNALYDFKINVDVPFTEPNYKVAPFVGFRWQSNGYNGVLYDVTNKRFKYFMTYAYGVANGTKYLFDPKEPEAGAKLFDWTTGKDMVYMSGTNQGSGLVFALMKDAAGQYSIYGITTGQYMNSPVQSTYIDIDASSAPGLANATHYVFHPTLPFLMYDNGSEVYLYDMAARSAKRVLTLSGENITMLKFNKLPSTYVPYPENIPDYQYRLAVGSAQSGAEAGSEGILRFYDVPEFAADLTQFGKTYSGFGIVKDIAYKAR